MLLRDPSLYLHEEVLLLALRDDKGTVHGRASMHAYALAGGIVAELCLADRVRLEDEKKKLVTVVSAEPLDDPILQECLTRIQRSKRRRRLADWVSAIAGMKDLRHRVALRLCDRGILNADRDKVLLIFSRRIYPELDARPEQRLIERLRKAILSDTTSVESRTAIVLGLAHAAGLLAIPFEKKLLRERRKHIETIARGESVGRATREAVQAAQAAAMAAASACVIVAATCAN